VNGLKLYKGAIHIHTSYSDGGGDMGEVVGAAKRAGLDFVIVTDHNSLQARKEGWEGWHDGVLVVVGAEVSPQFRAHCVALGVEDVEGLEELDEEEYLRRIRQQGGIAFMAHPLGRQLKLLKFQWMHWQDWLAPNVVGFELWSFMHDWITDVSWLNVVQSCRNPEQRIKGPSAEILAKWDEATQKTRLVALTSIDAHARAFITKRFTLFPYEFLFRTTLSYVWCDAFSGNAEADIKKLYGGLTSGQTAGVYERLGSGEGLEFVCRNGSESVTMGHETQINGTCHMSVVSPQTAQITLLCNGRTIARATGREIETQLFTPGVYRAQLTIDGRPWIYTNPIYIRDHDKKD